MNEKNYIVNPPSTVIVSVYKESYDLPSSFVSSAVF